MKFKLVENIDYEDFSYGILSQYLYDAVDELKNSSLERYIEWFRDNIPDQDKPHEELFITCVRDAYIDLVDSGKINREKTMITSRLKDYIESHADIIEDVAELMKQCPRHLQHELTLVLDKIDDPLNESLFDDAHYWNSPYDNAVFKYINENPDLVDDIETLYQRCSKYLKPSLVKILDHAEVVDSLSVKRAKYLLQTYDPLVLMNVIRDKDDTFRGNSAFDALEYGVNYWEDLFSDITLNESLNEELLTEATVPAYREMFLELLDALSNNEKFKQLLRTGSVNIHHIDSKYKDRKASTNHPFNIAVMSKRAHDILSGWNKSVKNRIKDDLKQRDAFTKNFYRIQEEMPDEVFDIHTCLPDFVIEIILNNNVTELV